MEKAVCSSHAAVMVYDDTARKWVAVNGSQGVARVQIYQHQQNNTYRVVGRIVGDNAVVINSAILKGLKYNQATPTFHQWRDSRQVYGLNFQSATDATEFAAAMVSALDALDLAAPARPQQAAPPAPSQTQNGPSQNDRLYNQQQQHEDINRRSGNLDNHSMPATRPSPPEPPSGPPAISRPAPAAPPAPPQPPAAPPAPAAPPVPAAPTPPAAPPVPAGPPAPPAPPAAGGGGPPPPPPPPPMGGPAASGGGGGGGGGGGAAPAGGGLAAALAGAKLRKVQKEEINDSSSASSGGGGGGSGGNRPAPSGGGGGGGDFMNALQQKLNKRRQASENPSGMDTNLKPSGRTSPPGAATKATSKPWERNNGVGNTTSSASPQLNRRRPSQPAMNGNGGGENSLDYEKLKQDILTEMRKELQKTKQEIIDAIKSELSRR